MKIPLILLAGLAVLQGCGPARDCGDLVGAWEGRLGQVVVRRAGAAFTLEFPASGRVLEMGCHNGTLSGDGPIRGSRNAAGKLVLDGFPGGVIETFAQVK